MAVRGRKLRWLLVGAVVVVVLAVAGPFIYIHFIEGPAPAKLTLPGGASSPVTTAVPQGGTATSTSTATSTATSTSTASAGTSAIDGTWHVGPGSVVGYRVQEVLIGQSATAVGRTTKVSGSVTVSGSSVQSGSFTVDMASVKSDQSQRNAQFDARIMEVSTYPTAELVLTSPIDLGGLSADGTVQQYQASGDLTMHGVTKKVDFTVSAKRSGDTVYVLADIPITFADWNIANPSVGGFVTTQNSGTLEVLLSLTKGAGNAAVTGSSGTAQPSPGGGGGGPVTVPATTVPPLKVPT